LHLASNKPDPVLINKDTITISHNTQPEKNRLRGRRVLGDITNNNAQINVQNVPEEPSLNNSLDTDTTDTDTLIDPTEYGYFFIVNINNNPSAQSKPVVAVNDLPVYIPEQMKQLDKLFELDKKNDKLRLDSEDAEQINDSMHLEASTLEFYDMKLQNLRELSGLLDNLSTQGTSRVDLMHYLDGMTKLERQTELNLVSLNSWYEKQKN
jgi:hypothetical protein